MTYIEELEEHPKAALYTNDPTAPGLAQAVHLYRVHESLEDEEVIDNDLLMAGGCKSCGG